MKKKETQQTKTTFNQKVNDFFQKRRTPVLISLIVIAAVFIGFLGFYGISNVMHKNANGKLDVLSGRYDDLKSEITADTSSDKVDTLIKDLEAFAKTAGAYAGGKAYGIIGDIHQQKKQFPEMEAAWIQSAKKAGKTYLAPIAWFNAAGAAEEQNNTEKAIEYYTKSLGTKSEFPLGAQSQFSIGRLKEKLGDTDGAIAAYRALISGWPHETVWLNMAHSRIIELDMAKQQAAGQ